MKRGKLWKAARGMPPLRHSVPGQDYDVRQSEVVRWLVQQPDILQIVFESVKDHKEIVFDRDTGTWRGIDYAD